MSRTRRPDRIFSHNALAYRPATGTRWKYGYPATAGSDPGTIVVNRITAQAITGDHQRLRAEVIAEYLAKQPAGGYYEDGLCHADALLARLHLDGIHLVCDMRHVAGDSDAVRSTEPDPAGMYHIGLGVTWRAISPSRCDNVFDSASPPPHHTIVISESDVAELAAAITRRGRVIWVAEHSSDLIEIRTADPHQPADSEKTAP